MKMICGNIHFEVLVRHLRLLLVSLYCLVCFIQAFVLPNSTFFVQHGLFVLLYLLVFLQYVALGCVQVFMSSVGQPLFGFLLVL